MCVCLNLSFIGYPHSVSWVVDVIGCVILDCCCWHAVCCGTASTRCLHIRGARAESNDDDVDDDATDAHVYSIFYKYSMHTLAF